MKELANEKLSNSDTRAAWKEKSQPKSLLNLNIFFLLFSFIMVVFSTFIIFFFFFPMNLNKINEDHEFLTRFHRFFYFFLHLLFLNIGFPFSIFFIYIIIWSHSHSSTQPQTRLRVLSPEVHFKDSSVRSLTIKAVE